MLFTDILYIKENKENVVFNKNKKGRKCRDTIYRFSLKMKVLQSVS